MAATLKEEKFSGDSLLELVQFRKATNKFFREISKKKNSIPTKCLHLESGKFLPKKGFQFNLFQVALVDTAVSE